MVLLQSAGGSAGSLILYNTVLGLAAGAALLLLVGFARYGATASDPVRNAWAWTFGALGGVLTVLGIHLSVTWPLLGAANIIFGEPSVMFGILLLAAAVIIARTPVNAGERNISDRTVTHGSSRSLGDRVGELRDVDEVFPDELMVALRPVAYVGALSGVMVILLALAGAAFGQIVFRPPSSEFPTGLVAGTGLEIVYMVLTYGLLGLGAMTLPLGLHNRSYLNPAGYLLVASGLLILFITFISFVGHVSLSSGVGPGGIPWPPSG